MIGNSSSGIIEAPYFKTPSINVGDRQSGRVSAKSVIHVNEKMSSIENAIKLAIKFNKSSNTSKFNNPYGKLQSSKKILNILDKINFNKNNTKKLFYDI